MHFNLWVSVRGGTDIEGDVGMYSTVHVQYCGFTFMVQCDGTSQCWKHRMAQSHVNKCNVPRSVIVHYHNGLYVVTDTISPGKSFAVYGFLFSVESR